MTDLFTQARTAFRAYTDTFRDADGKLPYAMQAKLQHTEEVCAITDELISYEGFSSERDILIFRLCALFHDVSRFEQVQKYQTFLDAASFDHGNRSAELILEKKFWDSPDSEIQKCVSLAVRVHNKLAIPADFPEKYLPAAKMVRDADKLAILNLVIRFFNGSVDDPTIRLNLPDSDSCTPEILETVASGKCVHYPDMRNVNDLKIGFFAWVNDLNYKGAFSYAMRHELFEKLRKLLPPDEKIDVILANSLDLIASKISN